MTEDPFETLPPSAPPRVWGDKAELHVPGGGAMGMALLIVSLAMIFGATIILFIIFRFVNPAAWHAADIALPRTLWVSTILIVISSGTIQSGLRAIRRDDEKNLVTGLSITLAIGVIFLALQSLNWFEVWSQIVASGGKRSFHIAFFYVLTFTHAAHVIGGLIPMGFTLAKARRGVYSRNFHPGVRYITIYWHFLDIVWVILFALMYLT